MLTYGAQRAIDNRTPAELADIGIGEVRSLLTSALMMETELVSRTLVFDIGLTQLSVTEFYNNAYIRSQKAKRKVC
jgi:hypothetical protein